MTKILTAAVTAALLAPVSTAVALLATMLADRHDRRRAARERQWLAAHRATQEGVRQ